MKREPLFIPAWIDEMRLTSQEFRVACHVARRGSCYASLPTIAEACRLSANTVRSSLKILVDLDVLSVQKRPGKTAVYSIAETPLPIPNEGIAPLPNGPIPSFGTPTKVDRTPLPNEGRGPLPNETYKGTPLKVIPLRNKESREEKPKAKPKRTAEKSWLEVLEMEWPGGLKNNPEFVELFEQWVSFRFRLKKITQEPTVFFGRQLKKLASFGTAGAIASVSKSLECEWQGIFEPDQRAMAQQARSKPEKQADQIDLKDFLA